MIFGRMWMKYWEDDMEKYGIMSLSEFKERTKSIARGEYRPSPDEPKKFFESQEAADRYYLKVYDNKTESEPHEFCIC